MMRLAGRHGFTLIELLTVLMIVGVLAAIGILHFAHTKEKAFITAMTSDLRNLATMEESFNASNQTYSASLSAVNFVPSPSVTPTVTDATQTGWAASATHSETSITCRVGFGSDSIPGVGDGVIQCN